MKNTLTLKEKREMCVLKQLKPTPTNRDLATQFKIHENTVCDILKQKSEYLRKISRPTLTEALKSAEVLLNFITYPPEKFETSTKQISTIRSVRSSILFYKSSLAHQCSINKYVNFDV
ncbi:1189_t:CDS:2 [Entrophospora sp. SA101]|nr:1189_t:CDS:2 [Entrophospora sp. SA101]